MTKMDCQIICQAAMALADGETAALNTEQVQAHLANCPDCRRVMGEFRSMSSAFSSQSRRVHAVNLWPRLADRITSEPPQLTALPLSVMFAILVAMLLMVRALVLTTAHPLEWGVRLLALLFVCGWFFLQRENPFTINPHLMEAKGNTL
jgi:predicted anti-sigma-YlaC factor YlaD